MSIGRPPSCECGTCDKCRHRLYMRDWYQRQTPQKRAAIVAARDPEVARRADQKRAGTPRRRESLRLAGERMRAKYPAQRAARVAVGNAVRDGRLKKEPCSKCGWTKVQAHHPRGYSPEHWLDVVWLCKPHHDLAHRTLRAPA